MLNLEADYQDFFLKQQTGQMDTTAISKKVDEVSSQVTNVHKKMTAIETKMEQMYTAIVGNKDLGHDGLVQRVVSLEEVREKWKTKIAWMYGYIFAVGTFMTFLLEYLKVKFIK